MIIVSSVERQNLSKIDHSAPPTRLAAALRPARFGLLLNLRMQEAVEGCQNLNITGRTILLNRRLDPRTGNESQTRVPRVVPTTCMRKKLRRHVVTCIDDSCDSANHGWPN
jgi:hypothetical protein